MREQGAVPEAHEPVHGRARMNDDLDLLVRDAEEPVRLDQLEPLVRERGGVHSDLSSHRPGRMCERLLDGDMRRARRACRPRNGPPDAVRTSDSTVSGSRPSRHWKSAECSLSTGSSRPPPRRCAATASSPAATRLSLFASASVTPCSSAHSVASTPAKPTMALRTTSGSHASSSSPPTPRPGGAGRHEPPRGRRAAACPTSARRARAPGSAPTISIACRRSSRWRRAGRRAHAMQGA